MSAKIFSEAMGLIGEKYIMEAATYQRKKKTVTKVWLSRVAGILLAILLAGSAVLTFSAEARAAFLGWVREQVDNFYHYFFEGEAAPSQPVKYELGWMPEGLEYVTTLDIDNGECFIYKDAKGLLIQFSYSPNGDNRSWGVDGVDDIQKTVKVNGNKADLYISRTDDQTSSIIWTNERNDFFALSGPFDEETLIKMAESVRAKPVRYELSYVPENCVFVTSYEIPGGKSFVYTDEKDSLISFTYQVGADGGSFFVDGVKAEKINVTINGCPGEISLYKDSEETDHIIWTDSTNKVLFYITGHFDQETFIKMAESVTEVVN